MSAQCGLSGAGSARLRACKPGQFPIRRLMLTTGGCRSESVVKIRSATDAVALVREHYAGMAQESVLVLLLHSNSEVAAVVEIGLGGIASAPVDPRLLLGAALSAGVPAFILAHNHPSGAVEPSYDDDQLTATVKKAAATVGLQMLDHVVVGKMSYFSYATAGRL